MLVGTGKGKLMGSGYYFTGFSKYCGEGRKKIKGNPSLILPGNQRQ